MDVTKHLERAGEAVRKKNFDFAITLYNQALALKPSHREARLGLMHAAAKRFELKGLAKPLRLIVGFPSLLAILYSKLFKNKDMLVRASQRYALIDPYNDAINFTLGHALESSGCLGGASAIYEFVAEYDQKNVNALKKAGFLMYNVKDIPAALELFEKVLAIAPRDPEAEKMRKNLAAESTLAKGSYTSARSSLELVVDKDEAARQQREVRIHRAADELQNEVDELKAKLETKPEDKRVQRSLIELLIRKKDYQDALEKLQRLLEMEPQSYETKSRIGDVELMVLEDELRGFQSRLQRGERSEELEAEMGRLQQKLLHKRVEELTWRVKEHPTELKLWFQLGRTYLQSKRIEEAIEAFQRSVKDPRHKVDSLRMLGKCFRAKGLFDLAQKQFQTALEAIGEGGSRSKEVIYDLGDVAERMGDRDAALSWFSKIYEIDINYKDVAAKIDSLKE